MRDNRGHMKLVHQPVKPVASPVGKVGIVGKLSEQVARPIIAKPVNGFIIKNVIRNIRLAAENERNPFYFFERSSSYAARRFS